jgi:enolase
VGFGTQMISKDESFDDKIEKIIYNTVNKVGSTLSTINSTLNQFIDEYILEIDDEEDFENQ